MIFRPEREGEDQVENKFKKKFRIQLQCEF